LIELNRSLHHPNLFSEFTKQASKEEKTVLVNTFYLPYRNAVESQIKQYIDSNQSVIHISVHAFTPILNNTERNCDIGLLFDSTKKQEKQFCKQLKITLKSFDSNLKVRYNYPYLGKADGFTTYLRKQFPESYVGIEIEINQKYAEDNRKKMILKKVLFDAITALKSINSK
jgi:predicted N-formylglutamate amidohydrolase